jgi:hypothetical protein
MKIIGEPIDGQPIAMHIIRSENGWSGVLCQNGKCQFEMRGNAVDEEALLAFTRQVLKEKFSIKDDYKLSVVND